MSVKEIRVLHKIFQVLTLLQFPGPEGTAATRHNCFEKAAVTEAWLQQFHPGSEWRDVCGFSQLCLPDGGVRHMGLLSSCPSVHWLLLGRSCSDEIPLSGCSDTPDHSPDCWVREGEVGSSFPINILLPGADGWCFVKPPVHQRTQTEDSRKDNASVPVQGHSLGTRTEDLRSILAFVEKHV